VQTFKLQLIFDDYQKIEKRYPASTSLLILTEEFRIAKACDGVTNVYLWQEEEDDTNTPFVMASWSRKSGSNHHLT
jgi:hypothetical protein